MSECDITTIGLHIDDQRRLRSVVQSDACRDCPVDPFLLSEQSRVAAAAIWLASWGAVAWSVLLAGCMIVRWRRSASFRRRLDLPESVAGLAVALVSALTAVRALTGPPSLGRLDVALWLGLGASLLAVAVGSVWPRLALRLTRLRLVRLVTESETAPPVGGLGATLRAVLQDPTLRLLYPEGDAELVDSAGRRTARPAPPVQVTNLQRGATTLAVLTHESRWSDTDPMLDEALRATRLALDHDRLHAENAWQLRRLQESRRRLVSEGDRERRALERDLHDGAQQVLLALALGLSVDELHSQDVERSALLQAAREEVTRALIALRSIALGVFPRELGDEGLAVADDEVLLRDGLAKLLDAAGLDVVGVAADAAGLIKEVALSRPDVAVVDIKMPPTHTDEGLQAAVRIRHDHPRIGVLVLSRYLDTRYAIRLLEEQTGGLCYLLKERVSHVQVVVDALGRLADGECVIDPTIVSHLLTRRRNRGALAGLTVREGEVLALMAEGYANGRIANTLALSPKTVERHVGHIFTKLDLPESDSHNRRVLLAVVAWLRAT